jgi:hypothetical protein
MIQTILEATGKHPGYDFLIFISVASRAACKGKIDTLRFFQMGVFGIVKQPQSEGKARAQQLSLLLGQGWAAACDIPRQLLRKPRYMAPGGSILRTQGVRPMLCS